MSVEHAPRGVCRNDCCEYPSLLIDEKRFVGLEYERCVETSPGSEPRDGFSRCCVHHFDHSLVPMTQTLLSVISVSSRLLGNGREFIAFTNSAQETYDLPPLGL